MSKLTEHQQAVARNVHRNNGGWIVRVMRNGSSHQKYFADNQHGGQAKALDAANTYSEWLREFLAGAPEAARRKGKPAMPLPTIAKPREPGISGVLGVALSCQIVKVTFSTPHRGVFQRCKPINC